MGAHLSRAPSAECLAFHRDFGHRLRVTRLALGLSEVEAAKAFRVSLRTYRKKWEAGLPFRGGHRGFVSFAKKYGVSPNWLVGGISDGLDPHLTMNRGSKLAILPLKTTPEGRRLAAEVEAARNQIAARGIRK